MPAAQMGGGIMRGGLHQHSECQQHIVRGMGEEGGEVREHVEGAGALPPLTCSPHTS